MRTAKPINRRRFGRRVWAIDIVDPIVWSRRWPLTDRRPRHMMAAPPQTGPPPFLSARDEARRQRVSFDVPTRPDRMAFGGERHCAESTLVDWAGAGRSMCFVPALRVRRRQPVHEARQLVARVGPQHQVPVVRHCRICQQSDRHSLQCFAQDFFVDLIVFVRMKEQGTSNCPIHHVIHASGGFSARSSWHRLVRSVPDQGKSSA